MGTLWMMTLVKPSWGMMRAANPNGEVRMEQYL
jgi:hypothetical protein